MKVWIVAVLALSSFCRGMRTPSHIRVQHEEDGSKIVLLQDFGRLVSFLFDKDHNMLDCDVLKLGHVANHEVALDREFLAGDYNVEYIEQEMDVAWYGRYCSKVLRNNERMRDKEDDIANQLFDRQQIIRPWPGTKFCASRYFSNHPDRHQPQSKTDACCHELSRCEHQLGQWRFENGYLNVYSYRLLGCDCVRKFRTCLQDLKTKPAKKMEELFFDVLNIRCLEKTNYDVCEEYDEWFSTCNNMTLVPEYKAVAPY